MKVRSNMESEEEPLGSYLTQQHYQDLSLSQDFHILFPIQRIIEQFVGVMVQWMDLITNVEEV